MTTATFTNKWEELQDGAKTHMCWIFKYDDSPEFVVLVHNGETGRYSVFAGNGASLILQPLLRVSAEAVRDNDIAAKVWDEHGVRDQFETFSNFRGEHYDWYDGRAMRLVPLDEYVVELKGENMLTVTPRP